MREAYETFCSNENKPRKVLVIRVLSLMRVFREGSSCV
jgi:hypothetical protein